MALPLRHQSRQRILPLEPHPSREIHNSIIEQNESAEDPKVPPNVTVVHTEASPKLITSRILTELAYPVRSYLHIPTSLRNVVLSVRLTRLLRAAH